MQNIKRRKRKIPWHDLAISLQKYFSVYIRTYLHWLCELRLKYCISGAFAKRISYIYNVQYTPTFDIQRPMHRVHPRALCSNKSAHMKFRRKVSVSSSVPLYFFSLFFSFGFIINIHIYFCAIPKLHIYVYLFFLSLPFHSARYALAYGTSILSIYDTREEKMCVYAAAAAAFIVVVIGIYFPFSIEFLVGISLWITNVHWISSKR